MTGALDHGGAMRVLLAAINAPKGEVDGDLAGLLDRIAGGRLPDGGAELGV